MKKIRFLITLILVVMMALLNGCTKEEKPTYDIAGKTFYNTVDEYGNAEHSNVWFGKDGSFVLKDNYFDGYYHCFGIPCITLCAIGIYLFGSFCMGTHYYTCVL